MRAITHIEALQELARLNKKFAMYVSFDSALSYTDIFNAAPYLNADNMTQLVCDGSGFLLFESKEEMSRYYKMTVGDDGPTELNSYNGECRVYALTCGPKGILQKENT